MAKLRVHPDRLEISLTRTEKALAMHPADIVIPRAAILSAVITGDPWSWLRGIRAPGTHLPGTLAIGSWRYEGGRDFYLVRRRRASVVIDIELESSASSEEHPAPASSDYRRVIISTSQAGQLISALRLSEGDETLSIATD
jgi:hypothetical protein